jgi:anti-sigma B factor antagonist
MLRDDIAQDDSLTLHVEDTDDAVTIYMVGECDIDTVPMLMEELTKALQSGRNVILDVHLLTYMDSTGISAIASAHESLADQRASLRVAGAHGIFSKVVKLTRLDQIVDFYETVEDARVGANQRPLTLPPTS